MTGRVLVVGNCNPDHAAIKRVVESRFDAVVWRAGGRTDALVLLEDQPFDLVLVNRKADGDGTDGIELIQWIRTHLPLAAVPLMLLSNFDHYQRQAVQAGAAWGFGKKDLHAAATTVRLAEFLPPRTP